MTNSRTCTAWGLAGSAILLSPIIVIFLIPLTIGVGLDIFDLVGEVPFALALCAPAAFVLLRRGVAADPGAPARGAVAAATAALSVGRAELRAEIDQLTHRRGGFQCREPLVDLTELEPPREQVIELQPALPP